MHLTEKTKSDDRISIMDKAPCELYAKRLESVHQLHKVIKTRKENVVIQTG